MPVLQIISEKLYTGADWSWTESLSDYPATDYTLQIILKQGGTGTPVVLDGAANGNDFDFTKPGNKTLLLSVGEYYCQGIAKKISDNKITVLDQQNIFLLRFISSTADHRTYWEKVLDAALTAYNSLVSREVTEVTYEGRTLKYKDRAELKAIIADAKEEIKAQDPAEVNKPKLFKVRYL